MDGDERRGDLEVAATALASILEHSDAAYPNECCGVLVGSGGRVAIALPLVNEAADPQTAYAIGPEQYIKAELFAGSSGSSVVGFYHSHPEGHPTPSAADVVAAWPDTPYLIIGGRRGGAAEIRVWRMTDVVAEVAWS